jgi:hypothetical protein
MKLIVAFCNFANAPKIIVSVFLVRDITYPLPQPGFSDVIIGGSCTGRSPVRGDF